MSAKRFGIGFLGESEVTGIIKKAQKAETMGFGTCWIAEDYFYGGAFSIATACAANTKSLKIGIGVINPYSRHPALTAMEVAALKNFSNDRLILGLGTSNPIWMQTKMGIPFERPLTSLKEAIIIIREMLSGRNVNYEGKIFNIRNVQLEMPVKGAVPIYLGVKSEKSLNIAGEMADGVLLSVGTSVKYVKWVKEQLSVGAKRAGRSLECFDIAAYLLISIDEDREKARNALRNRIARYVGLHGNHPIMMVAGFEPEDLKPFREAFLQEKEAGYLVTEKMIDTLAIAGTPEECKWRLKEILDAGVTQPVLFELPEIPMEENMTKVQEVLFPVLEQYES